MCKFIYRWTKCYHISFLIFINIGFQGFSMNTIYNLNCTRSWSSGYGILRTALIPTRGLFLFCSPSVGWLSETWTDPQRLSRWFHNQSLPILPWEPLVLWGFGNTWELVAVLWFWFSQKINKNQNWRWIL